MNRKSQNAADGRSNGHEGFQEPLSSILRGPAESLSDARTYRPLSTHRGH